MYMRNPNEKLVNLILRDVCVSDCVHMCMSKCHKDQKKASYLGVTGSCKLRDVDSEN